MAHYQTTPTLGTTTGLTLGNALHRIVATVRDWNQSRVTRKALSNLTDHELDDIGLVRSDIASF
ncbi:DUF1127 domain-containing protein [Oceaniglobus indicus]|uniref:DUF1127 domain-containing protein n=1 Tax=Oceaniglobus indicus TaxID=2047749 RepID=UPI000C18E242|nr:DUF1127 domain-containing protein [Oceaniglobus indicus]